MSTFLNRLKVYGIGFAIGMVFVFFFFQNRGCSWLPGNRVKNSILDRVIVIPESEAAALKAKGITSEDVITLLNDGDVDFGKSKKQGSFKVYFIEKDNMKIYFTLPEESFISEVRLANRPVGKIKTSTTGTGKFIRFPKDDELVFTDTLSKVACEQRAFGMPKSKAILRSLKQNGKIDFSKSGMNVKPKAEHYLYFNDSQGRRIGAQAVWYKNKISINRFDLPFTNDCQ